MDKYDFHILKNKNNSDALPEDINNQIESLADKIGDEEGKSALIDYRIKKWFGDVNLWATDGKLIAIAYFDHGICFRYKIISYRKDGVTPKSILSVKNEMLKLTQKGDKNE